MSPDTHRRATELFNELRDLPPDEAAQRLQAEVGEQSEVRDLVLRLLDADREVSRNAFLNNGAIEDAARLLTRQAVGLPLPGTVIGHYRLERQIGAGGMGVVYLAEDQRLSRRVALKIIRKQYAVDDEEGEQRFQQEVRAVALLSHPNIVGLLDAGRWEGHSYLAMEYVEGQTLRDLISAHPRGLDMKTILDRVAQVAAALEAAHEAGIVHRDIKPENIMVRPDGFVKVLDFGLAKLRTRAADASQFVSVFQSQAGGLAGTIHYLSPEQVTGKRVDRRSDLFSLGVVTYELGAGRRPFDGPTEGAIFDAILNSVPPSPAVVRPDVGEEFGWLVMQAIEKDVDLRLQTAGDFRSGCKRLARDSASGKIVRPIAPRSSFRAVPALIAFAILASLAVIWFFMTRNAEEPARLLSFERLSDRPGEERHPSFSSDGKQFVYASLTGDQWNIYLQRTGGSAAIQLTQGLGDCMQPALSPDGAHILFRAERDGGGLYVMEPTGENPRRLTADGYYPAWAPDSRHFVYSEVNFISPSQRGVQVNLLHIADTADGSQRTLVSGDAAQPAWSPHGYRIAYWSLRAGGQRDIVTVAASGKESPLAVTNDSALDWNPVWSPSGRYLYFLSDRGGPMNVWRVRIDEQTGRTLRAPEPITVPANYVGGLSFSGVGDEFIYSNALRESTLHRLDFDLEHQTIKGAPQRVATSVHSISNFAFSPDGSELVYDTLGDSLENLWIMNVDGSGRRRLTSGPYKDRVPIWSPRGDEIVFFSDRGGPYDNWIIKPDGSGLRRLTALTNPDIQRSVWSPDGARLLAARNHGPAAFLNPEGTSPVTDPPAAAGLENVQDVLFTAWSENLIVGEIEPEVVLYEGGHLTRTGRKGHVPMIPRDPANRGSRYLLYARGGDVLLYDRTADRETKLFSVAPSRIYMLVSPPGGGSLYFTEAASDGDLWSARFLPETVPRHDPE